jgi:hypothetical protein
MFLIQDLFNEPSTSQQCLIDQQHRLGNIDTTVKRSQVNNVMPGNFYC